MVRQHWSIEGLSASYQMFCSCVSNSRSPQQDLEQSIEHVFMGMEVADECTQQQFSSVQSYTPEGNQHCRRRMAAVTVVANQAKLALCNCFGQHSQLPSRGSSVQCLNLRQASNAHTTSVLISAALVVLGASTKSRCTEAMYQALCHTDAWQHSWV